MFIDLVSSDGIDAGVKVESGDLWIVLSNVDRGWIVVRYQSYSPGSVVVEVRKGDFILSPDRVSQNDLVNIVKLVPVLVEIAEITIERFESRTSRDGKVESFGCEERFEVEEIVIVFVDYVRKHLARQTVQVGHDVQWKVPLPVRRPADHLAVLEGLMVVKPVIHSVVLLKIQLHIDRLKGLHLEDIVSVVKRSLFIVEGREPHSLEMPSISLFSSHHNPHSAPLSSENRLDNLGDLVHKTDSSGNVVKHFHSPDLFPRHRRVFEQFEHRVGSVFECSQEDSLVGAVLAA